MRRSLLAAQWCWKGWCIEVQLRKAARVRNVVQDVVRSAMGCLYHVAKQIRLITVGKQMQKRLSSEDTMFTNATGLRQL
jgi:hypothetical protein